MVTENRTTPLPNVPGNGKDRMAASSSEEAGELVLVIVP
jgi:hypothetical protein